MTKTIRKEIIEEFDDKGNLIQRTTTEETVEETPDTVQPYPYWGIDRTGDFNNPHRIDFTYCSDETAPTAYYKSDTTTNTTAESIHDEDPNQCTIEDFFRGK